MEELRNTPSIYACVLIVDRNFQKSMVKRLLKDLSDNGCNQLLVYGKNWPRVRKLCRKNHYKMCLKRIRKRGDSFTDTLEDIYYIQNEDKKAKREQSPVFFICNDMKMRRRADAYLCYIDRITCDISFGEPIKGKELIDFYRKHLHDYYYADVVAQYIDGRYIYGRVVDIIRDPENAEQFSGIVIREINNKKTTVYLDEVEDLSLQEGGQWPYSDQMSKYIDLWRQGKIEIGTDFCFDLESVPLDKR